MLNTILHICSPHFVLCMSRAKEKEREKKSMHNLSTIVGKSEDHYGVLCRVPEPRMTRDFSKKEDLHIKIHHWTAWTLDEQLAPARTRLVSPRHWLETSLIGLVGSAKPCERGSVVRWGLAWLSKRITLSNDWQSMSKLGSPSRKVRSPEFVYFPFSMFSGGARLVMRIRGIEVCQWNLSHNRLILIIEFL